MSTLHHEQIGQIPGDSQGTKSEAGDKFFETLKDMIDLLKSWTLGAALLGAGFTFISSKFPIVLRIVGAFTCITMGAMVFISAVLIFSRHRMAMIGQPVMEQVKRIFKFVLLMTCGLFVCYTTMEFLKQTVKTSEAGSHATHTSETQ